MADPNYQAVPEESMALETANGDSAAEPRRRSQRLSNKPVLSMAAPATRKARAANKKNKMDTDDGEVVVATDDVAVEAPAVPEVVGDIGSESSELSELDFEGEAGPSRTLNEDFTTADTNETSFIDEVEEMKGDSFMKFLGEDFGFGYVDNDVSDGGRPVKHTKHQEVGEEQGSVYPVAEIDRQMWPVSAAFPNRDFQTHDQDLPIEYLTPTNLTSTALHIHNKELPPLLTPDLPPGLEFYMSLNTNDETNQVNPTTMPDQEAPKMVIISKSHLDNLKSSHDTLLNHNAVLREHNISLARSNTSPTNHTNCVAKPTHDALLTTHAADYTLWKECGEEWARRESLWEHERQLLKRNIIGLKGQVDSTAAHARDLAGRVTAMALREVKLVEAVKAWEEKTKEVEREREEWKVRAVQLQREVGALRLGLSQAKGDDRQDQGDTVYPEV